MHHNVTSLRTRKQGGEDLAKRTKNLIDAQGQCLIDTNRAVITTAFACASVSMELFRVSQSAIQLGLLYR